VQRTLNQTERSMDGNFVPRQRRPS
jgi:hypothetical protein